MKIACINDLHLNIVSYTKIMDKEFVNLPFRQGDFLRAFKEMVSQCVDDIKPELVILGGDIYDHYEPSNEIRGFFTSQLERFVAADIPVIIIVGNHDVCKKHHSLKGIQNLNLKNIKVLEEPKMVTFKGYQLLLFPYSVSVERQVVKIKDQYNKFLEDCKEKRTDTPAIFVGHFGINGATISEYNLKKRDVKIKGSYVNDSGDDISVSDIDNLSDLNVEHVLMGDYHKHQILPTSDCFAMYSGSIEKTDFTERDQKKGFLVYDSDNEEIEGYGKCRFVEYKGCRPMLELEGTLIEMKKQFDQVNKTKYQSATVKFKFEGDRHESTAFSLGLRDFKKEITDAISPMHMVHESKVKDVEREEKVKELKEEIKSTESVGEGDVITILREMIGERAENKTEAKALKSMMEEYYTQNRGQ